MYMKIILTNACALNKFLYTIPTFWYRLDQEMVEIAVDLMFLQIIVMNVFA